MRLSLVISEYCEICRLQTEAAVNPVPVLCMITMLYPCLMWSPDAGRRVESWRKKALWLGQQTTYSQVISQELIHNNGVTLLSSSAPASTYGPVWSMSKLKKDSMSELVNSLKLIQTPKSELFQIEVNLEIKCNSVSWLLKLGKSHRDPKGFPYNHLLTGATYCFHLVYSKLP